MRGLQIFSSSNFWIIPTILFVSTTNVGVRTVETILIHANSEILNTNIFHVFGFSLQFTIVNSQEFDRDFLGVVFDPYVKHSYVKKANYSFSEVTTLLDIAGSKFKWITTYEQGSNGTTNVISDFFMTPCITRWERLL